MNDIYEALEPLKSNPNKSGVFSDLDGTLSKIAPVPAAAVVAPEMRAILKALTERYEVVGVVSGRDSNEAKRIVGLENVVYIGNHGLEWIEDNKQFYAPEAFNYLGLASSLASELTEILNGSNLLVEKKKLGVAVHYRQAEDKEWARLLIERVLNPLVAKYPLKKFEGRYVVELKPDLPVNKGDAVTVVALRRNLERVVYFGDDITDVDAFRALSRLREEGKLGTVSIGVISEESAPSLIHEADYLVDGVDDVQRLLGWLAG